MSEPPKRRLAASPRTQDALLAAVVLLGCILIGEFDWSVVWIAPAAVALAAVALRRRFPGAALAAGVGSCAVVTIAAGPPLLTQIAVLIGLYTFTVQRRPLHSLFALIAIAALLLTWQSVAAELGLPRANLYMNLGVGQTTDTVVVESGLWQGQAMPLAFLVAAWALGVAAHGRGARLDALRSRAADLERDRDRKAALAVAEERARISREMHDAVAHHLSVMVIQAQAAQSAIDRNPGDARTALGSIVHTGRSALEDMRTVLGALGEADRSLRPAPGIDAISELAAQVGRAGTLVRLRVEGEPGPLAPVVSLSAYRIVQEALTNTMKHAGPGASADVELRHEPRLLTVTVRDDGSAPPKGEGGRGLPGMRERVRLLGGSLEAGPGEHGFNVRAVLPTDGGRP